MAPDESIHVRSPLQSRSRRTLERLVAAAHEIIAEEGVEAATVSSIVRRANSSVGSFYARFEGKEDFLRYLEERVWELARERWDAATAAESWSELGLSGVIRSIVGLLVRMHIEDAGSRRALGRDRRSPGSGGEARHFHEYLEGEVSALLLRHAPEIRHPMPERAARVAYGWAVGGVRELLSDPGPLSPEIVSEEITRGLTAYLRGSTDDGETAGNVDFFDVWQ